MNLAQKCCQNNNSTHHLWVLKNNKKPQPHFSPIIAQKHPTKHQNGAKLVLKTAQSPPPPHQKATLSPKGGQGVGCRGSRRKPRGAARYSTSSTTQAIHNLAPKSSSKKKCFLHLQAQNILNFPFDMASNLWNCFCTPSTPHAHVFHTLSKVVAPPYTLILVLFSIAVKVLYSIVFKGG